jgi:hypothetical protein
MLCRQLMLQNRCRSRTYLCNKRNFSYLHKISECRVNITSRKPCSTWLDSTI